MRKDASKYQRTKQASCWRDWAGIDAALAQMKQQMQLPCADAEHGEQRYQPTGNLKAMAPCEFIIESIVEDLQIKQSVFDQLEQIVGQTVPIASNTSVLPISVLQKTRRHPERFVGMHWGEPAHIMRFLEMIRGEQTQDPAFDATAVLARQLGKEPSTIQRDVRGFVSKQPNLLLVTADGMRYDALRCNDNPLAQSPRLDALAQEGVNFQRAYCAQPLCMPCRSTMVADRYKLSVCSNGHEGELYDLREDPKELTNLFGQPQVAQVQAQLMHKFSVEMLRQMDPPLQREACW